MRTRSGRRVVVAVLGTLALGAGLLTAPAAAAVTPVVTFASIDATFSGCSGARIDGISESDGARYLYRGRRLRFPTKTLPFDARGQIELTAEPTHGRTVTQERGRLLAPEACFTNIHVADEPRYDPVVSWCTTTSTPALEQEFQSESLDDVTASWQLTRRSTGKVVAGGTATIYLGVGPVDFPLPTALPKGRYLLTVRDAASPASLFPYSMPAEQYRCLPEPTVERGAVTFRVPKGGPSVDLNLATPASPEAVVMHVRAGRAYTFRTSEPEVSWRADAHGNHVGDLGSGFVELSRTR